MRYPAITRSENALTIEKQSQMMSRFSYQSRLLMLNVSRLREYRRHQQHRYESSRPCARLDIQFMDIQYASLFKDDNTFEMSRTNPKSLYRDDDNVRTGMRAIVYKNIDAKAGQSSTKRSYALEGVSKMITNLLQSIIDENVRSGFMHNDLHLENVVFDRDTYTLRTLDYGVIGQSVHAKIHIEYRYHRRRHFTRAS
jgi:hypothetical protein